MRNMMDQIRTKLTDKGKTLSVAESCTGGALMQMLTKASGASRFFQGGIVAYSNEVKIRSLLVDRQTLIDEGVVSEAVLRQMLTGCHKLFSTDYALATTGIAGPSGASLQKPVGTVWMGIADATKQIVWKEHFIGSRFRIIHKCVEAILKRMEEII